jgi:hypothetical protein
MPITSNPPTEGTNETEIEVSRKGLRATGPATVIVGVGLAIAISAFGLSKLGGWSTNEEEHAAFRGALTITEEHVKSVETKLDLIIQLLNERQKNIE